jgi:hypothetical protein
MKTRFPIEIVIALSVNAVIVLLLFRVSFAPPPPPPVNVEVDISNFKLPKPEIIPQLKQEPEQTQNQKLSPSAARAAKAKSDKALVDAAMNNVAPQDISEAITKDQSISQKNEEVKNIMHDMKLWNNLKSFKSSKTNSSLPPGLQTGASFKSRGNLAARKRLLKRYGGGARSEYAVAKALRYLAKRQNPNGSWGGAQSFKTGDAAALSSLTLLAFLAHGENFTSKKYGKNVTKGADFLCKLADMPKIEFAGKGFGHAILTYALAETYALTGSLTLRRKLARRLEVIIERQNRFGSFNLNYDNSPCPVPAAEEDAAKVQTMVGEPRCDLSLLGWHIQAMVAAKNSGVNVEGLDKALQLSLEALVKIHQAARGGFSQGINMKRFAFDPNLNAVGLLGTQLLNAGRSSPAHRAKKILKNDGKMLLPRWKKSRHFPLYRWYYQTQALFQSEKGRGKIWESWNNNFKAELLRYQKSDGSWSVPGKSKGFQLKDRVDLTLYSTSLCLLMLQVYYRYLPNYSIAESSGFRNITADDLDLGRMGLITKLPGGADPLANIILGMGPTTMEPITFGIFNGIPASAKTDHVKDEFKIYSSFSSTVPVRNIDEWPQLLQPNQRITLFIDELIPENFKGDLQLQLALTGTQEAAFASEMSMEVVINSKRLYNSKLLRNKNLVELFISAGHLQPFSNILQIRNNGSAPLAFDAVKLSAISKVGKPVYLAAENFAEIPEYIRDLFTVGIFTVTGETTLKEIATQLNQIRAAKAKTMLRTQKVSPGNFAAMVDKFAGKVNFWELESPKQLEILRKVKPQARIVSQQKKSGNDAVSFKLSSYVDNRQVLPSLVTLGEYSPNGEYWGRWTSHGSESMGYNFQKNYLRQIGRQVIDWIASGGTAVTLSNIVNGGVFYDTIFKNELPALCALRQVAKLFEGNPRKLPANIYPKYGEKPLFAENISAVYNAPGVATVVVVKRFPVPEETEIQVLIPWSGTTELSIENGFIPGKHPFAGIGTPLRKLKKTLQINDNIFKYSGVLSEMTVFRLVRKGGKERLKPIKTAHYVPADPKFDLHSAKVQSPELITELRRVAYRDPNGFAAVSNPDISFYRIPATVTEGTFKPAEEQSIEITFPVKKDQKRHDSAYLQLGKGEAKAEFMSFTVYARVRNSTYSSIPLRFVFSGKCFKISVPVNKWRRIIIPFDENLPAPNWQSLRLLEPNRIISKKMTAVAYEINDIAVYTKTQKPKIKNPVSKPEKTKSKKNLKKSR